jgi:hypothetical protein
MINFCSYVQWVPKSDVVVAQSNDSLCVWYNTEHVERCTQFPIQGEVEEVVRDENRTEVIVQVRSYEYLPFSYSSMSSSRRDLFYSSNLTRSDIAIALFS